MNFCFVSQPKKKNVKFELNAAQHTRGHGQAHTHTGTPLAQHNTQHVLRYFVNAAPSVYECVVVVYVYAQCCLCWCIPCSANSSSGSAARNNNFFAVGAAAAFALFLCVRVCVLSNLTQ